MAKKKKFTVDIIPDKVVKPKEPERPIDELYNEATVRTKVGAKHDSVGIDVLFSKSVIRLVVYKCGKIKSKLIKL